MVKIGIIATPYEYMAEIKRQNKKMELDHIKILEHGKIEKDIPDYLLTVKATIIDPKTGNEAHANLILDTGSNITVVSPKIAISFEKSEGIPVFGTQVSGQSSTIVCRLQMEDTVTIDSYEIRVLDLNVFEKAGIDGVIGMDIIQAGDLHVFRKDGFPHFEFTL